MILKRARQYFDVVSPQRRGDGVAAKACHVPTFKSKRDAIGIINQQTALHNASNRLRASAMVIVSTNSSVMVLRQATNQ